NKQLYMIEKPNFIEFEDESYQDSKSNNPPDIADAQAIKMVFANAIKGLNKPERRLLLMMWASDTKLTAGQALLMIQADEKISNFEALNIKSENDLYNSLNRIAKEITEYIQKHNLDFFLEYDLNEKKCKEMTKIYLENFVII
ncbi:MAG: hypothetical protein K8R68_01020, partial [Bacteroidales bacterium]|nr:hypothetical protein [Bacteroidales bacterium]